MPVRKWRSSKDWTAGFWGATRHASSTPRGAAQLCIPLQPPRRFRESFYIAHQSQLLGTALVSDSQALVSNAVDEKDQAHLTGCEPTTSTPATIPPRELTYLPVEGEMEGDSESQAQGDVVSENYYRLSLAPGSGMAA